MLALNDCVTMTKSSYLIESSGKISLRAEREKFSKEMFFVSGILCCVTGRSSDLVSRKSLKTRNEFYVIGRKNLD